MTRNLICIPFSHRLHQCRYYVSREITAGTDMLHTWLALVVVSAVVCMAACTAGAAQFARALPADVDLYVQIDDLGVLADHQFTHAMVDALAAVDGTSVSNPDDTTSADDASWQSLVSQTFGMPVDTLITTYLSDTMAVAVRRIHKPADAVLLCTPSRSEAANELLTATGATLLRNVGTAQIWLLEDMTTAIGIWRDWIVIGPTAAPNSLFIEVVTRIGTSESETACLADDPQFITQQQRMRDNWKGLLYLKPHTDYTTQPSASSMNLPERISPGRHVAHAVAALYNEPDGATVDIHAKMNTEYAVPPGGPALRHDDALRLPASTLALWCTRVWPMAAYTTFKQAQPNDALLRTYVGLLEILLPEESTRTTLLESIGPQAMIAVIEKETLLADTASQPAIASPHPAILLRVEDAATIEPAVDRAFMGIAMLLNFQNLKQQNKTPIAVQRREDASGALLRWIDPTPFLASRSVPGWLKQVKLCWTILDSYLVITTDIDVLQQIVDSWHGRCATLTEAIEIAPLTTGQVDSDLTILVQPARVARLLTRLEPYLPGQRVHLGIDAVAVAADAEGATPCGALVNRVYRGYGGFGRLLPRDIITAIDDMALDGEAPVVEIRNHLETIRLPAVTRLTVFRNGTHMRVDVPLNIPLSRIAAALARLGQPTRSAILQVHRDADLELSATLALRWQNEPIDYDDISLVTSSQPAVATQPAPTTSTAPVELPGV